MDEMYHTALSNSKTQEEKAALHELTIEKLVEIMLIMRPKKPKMKLIGPIMRLMKPKMKPIGPIMRLMIQSVQQIGLFM
jgi:hypothetical protein